MTASTSVLAEDAAWSRIATVAPGKPQAIGGAANGCLIGAEALPAQGDGFVTIRRHRGRYYGHPRTLALVRELSAAVARDSGQWLMIGDIAQPRGGLMSSLHRSHQNGLDVDIWFWLVTAPEQAAHFDAEAHRPPSMVTEDGGGLAPTWGAAQTALLRRVAEHPLTERIFVNPAIKRALCANERDRRWLRRVRPWRGHDAHFHLRLRCPTDSPACEPGAPLPPGDGCGAELDWWFSAEARAPLPATGAARARPAICRVLLAIDRPD